MKIYQLEHYQQWGKKIEFWPAGSATRIVGWVKPRPQIGDELHCNMESGKVGRFRINKVDYKSDPGDMFFADVMFIGYKND